MEMLSSLFLHVTVGSVAIDVAAKDAITLRDRLGVSLSLEFAKGTVEVTPSMTAVDIINDYRELD